ncbi:MAG: DUF554 domain-containing protein [Armatimonadetes bacterium]|nr:DUF554 domain-containing protein [Armatimonadota bacterium]
MRGTLLNTATILVGAAIGVLAKSSLQPEWNAAAMAGLGLASVGMGIRMFLRTSNPLVPAMSIAIGGIIGAMLGIHGAIDGLATTLKGALPGDWGRFNEGLITSFVLYCIGPMTLLGCVQDALEKKIELLALKSAMDGIAAIFLAASFGPALFVTAFLVLIFQGLLTLGAKTLEPVLRDEKRLNELTAAGGCILLATGIGLMGIKDLRSSTYLPALVLAPIFTVWIGRLERRLSA